MSELLEALQAAAVVGFDAPACYWCSAGPMATREEYRRNCNDCHGAGIDASDPFGLIGRAMTWFWTQGRNVTDDEYLSISAAVRDAETGCGMRGLKLAGDHRVERHDGTPAGIATALLRLVARVGSTSAEGTRPTSPSTPE